MKARSLLWFILAATSIACTAPASDRDIEFNGRKLTKAEFATVRQLEQQLGPIPNGRYWYDPATGAAGILNGPVATLLPPGLSLGGPLAASASGGGDGRLTGVFVNGRELHPHDVARLQQLTPVMTGRYRWDAAGNIALETGQFLFNFFALLQSKGASNPYFRSDVSRGESTFVGQGCAAVSGRVSPSDSNSTYDYYVGCD